MSAVELKDFAYICVKFNYLKMIIITGAAGFIGSCLAGKLNNHGFKNLVLVDDFSHPPKNKNWEQKSYSARVERLDFFEWLQKNYAEVSFVFHLGARTDTTEFDKAIFDKLNFDYSQKVWSYCAQYQIPLVYASSAATYGAGENGYEDAHSVIPFLKPLNPYGDSKNEFDKWVLKQDTQPPFWAGLKFFNVFGPNEYHKGRMASVVFHAFKQISREKSLKLFKSHRSDFEDGMQKRDFVYVKDVVDVCLFFMSQKPKSGIYNLGSGFARSFLDLGLACFRAMGIEPDIKYVDIPEDIRDNYQYFTEAQMSKLASVGYGKNFTSLEDSINDYINNYLAKEKYY